MKTAKKLRKKDSESNILGNDDEKDEDAPLVSCENKLSGLLLDISDQTDELDRNRIASSVYCGDYDAFCKWEFTVPSPKYITQPKRRAKPVSDAPSDVYNKNGEVVRGSKSYELDFVDSPAWKICVEPTTYRYLPNNGRYRASKLAKKLEIQKHMRKIAHGEKLTPEQRQLQREIQRELRKEFEMYIKLEKQRSILQHKVIVEKDPNYSNTSSRSAKSHSEKSHKHSSKDYYNHKKDKRLSRSNTDIIDNVAKAQDPLQGIEEHPDELSNKGVKGNQGGSTEPFNPETFIPSPVQLPPIDVPIRLEQSVDVYLTNLSSRSVLYREALRKDNLFLQQAGEDLGETKLTPRRTASEPPPVQNLHDITQSSGNFTFAPTSANELMILSNAFKNKISVPTNTPSNSASGDRTQNELALQYKRERSKDKLKSIDSKESTHRGALSEQVFSVRSLKNNNEISEPVKYRLSRESQVRASSKSATSVDKNTTQNIHGILDSRSGKSESSLDASIAGAAHLNYTAGELFKIPKLGPNIASAPPASTYYNREHSPKVKTKSRSRYSPTRHSITQLQKSRETLKHVITTTKYTNGSHKLHHPYSRTDNSSDGEMVSSPTSESSRLVSKSVVSDGFTAVPLGAKRSSVDKKKDDIQAAPVLQPELLPEISGRRVDLTTTSQRII